MADIDKETIAIIAICVALGVTFITLLLCLICYCRLRIQDDTNIRKRVLGRQYMAGAYMGQDQVKTTQIMQQEMPAPMPYIPEQRPLPRREIYPPTPPPQPPSPPQPSQPEIIVHEVVHRYQPTQPAFVLPPPTAPPMPDLPPHRVLRRSSWCAPPETPEWVMIKKTKKTNKGRKSRRDDSDSSSDDSDDEVYTKKKKRHHGHAVYGHGLAHYDLAMPMAMGMRPANIMMGGQPMMAAPMMMAPVATGMPMMATTAATFQPTYGAVLPMM